MNLRSLPAVVIVGALLCSCAGQSAVVPDRTPGGEIVVMAPAAAEMLEALDLLDRVVAIGEYGPWPDAIATLPQAGAYNAPNVELVLSLGARMVITTASEASLGPNAWLESLGVDVLSLDTSTFEGVFASLIRLGEALDRREEAVELERLLRRELAEIETRSAGLPRRKVLFVVGRDPIYVAGPGSHIDRMITLAGGENIVHDGLAPYQRVSVEAILERLPEVIVDSSDNGGGALRGRQLGGWGRWPFLPAVEQDSVYWIDPSRLVIPGLRLPEMTRLMGRLIHPEVFGEASDEEFEPRRNPPRPDS